MAALSVLNPTLLDVTKRMAPDGSIDNIAEMLNQTNEILEDMTFTEGNLPTGHRSTVRTGLPSVTWRKLYGGVQPSKSTTAQITDNCGMLEAYAEVDKALADLNGNAPAFRLSEDRAFIESMNIEFADTLWHGNEGTEPEAFTGFGPRFNSLSAANAENIINSTSTGGGDTPKSAWLIGWSPETCHGIYPKGSIAGLQMKDMGEVTVENVDGAGGRAQMYRSHYRWDVGLTVRDWRYIVRIQYDEGELVKNAASGADLIDLMAQALELPPSLKNARFCFYGNRTFKSFLRRQIVNKVGNSTLTMDQVAGKHVMTFDGIPVKRSDQLAVAETRVA